MAMPIYMKITGTNGGEITGGCSVEEYEGHMQVRAIDHTISVPMMESTGMHSGRRVHGPIVILKDMDSSTPQLYKAMVDHDVLDVELFWYRHNPDGGTEELYFTTTLTAATIVSVSNHMPNQYVKDNQGAPHMEEIKLAYHTIVWNYVPTGVEAQDSHASTA